MSIKLFFTSKRTFVLLIFLVGIAWVSNSLIDFFCSLLSTWDTGAHIQPVIHWALYGNYEDRLLDVSHPFLNHFRPGLLILAPFVKLFPSMLVIHFAKIITFLTSAFLFLYYGKKHGLKEWAYLLPILWCVHDVLITTMFAENQATALSIPFIVWAFFLAFEKKYKLMLFPLCIIVFFKESLPLVWVSMGLFIALEQKKLKWGGFISFLGCLIGLLIYFVVIPYFGQGELNHQHQSLFPFQHVGLKLLMLFKAHLAMGLFVVLWPRVFLISLPLYAVYLLGGDGVYRAFWLGSHNHDYTTAFLFCMAFFVLKKVFAGQTWFKMDSKLHINIAKTMVCILFTVGVSKLPFFKWLGAYEKYPVGFQLRQLSYQIKPQLDPSYTTYVSPRLMEYFIDLKYIKSFDNKHYRKIFELDKPFILIFSNNKAFHNMRSNVVEFYYKTLQEHSKEGFCSLKEFIHENGAHLVVATYATPLSNPSKKEVLAMVANL